MKIESRDYQALKAAVRQLIRERKRLNWILGKCPLLWVLDENGILINRYVGSRRYLDIYAKRDHR